MKEPCIRSHTGSPRLRILTHEAHGAATVQFHFLEHGGMKLSTISGLERITDLGRTSRHVPDVPSDADMGEKECPLQLCDGLRIQFMALKQAPNLACRHCFAE
jgi:hypothetical protein